MKVEYVGNDCIVYNSEFSLALTLDCGQAFRFYEKDGIWYGVVDSGVRVVSSVSGMTAASS